VLVLVAQHEGQFPCHGRSCEIAVGVTPTLPRLGQCGGIAAPLRRFFQII
jgi:hypothetical protein